MKLFELRLRLIAPFAVLCCLIGVGSQSAHAATCTPVIGGTGGGALLPDTILILGTTVTDGCLSLEAVQALALNLNVEIDDDIAWGAKSKAQFATYRAIVLGDPVCVGGTGPITKAENTREIWGAAITGPVAIIGTDPAYHARYNNPTQSTTATQLTQNAIAFAVSDSGRPGAYIALSCYYAGAAANTPVLVLSPFGSFTVQGQNTNNSHIVAPAHPLARNSH